MTTRYEPSASYGPASISIMEVLRGVLRRKLFIIGMGAVAFGIGFGLVKVLKPVYSTEAQVLIQNQETPFDRVQPAENQRADAIDDRVVASQISVIKSDDLGRRVVAALGLENKPEFNPLINGVGTVGKIKIALGFGTDPALKTPEQRALDYYSEELGVFQLPASNVVGIRFSAKDPEIAARIANTLAETYVLWTRESQSQPTERAREWLSQQIEALRRKVADSEQAVEQFRAEAGLLQGTATTLGTQGISELNSQITVAKGAALEARAKADAIRDMLATSGSVDTATDVLASQVVQRLKEQRTDATRRRAELSVTYLPNHPKMVAVETEITNIDRQIRAEALKVVASLDEQARVAESREKSLEQNLAMLKATESAANLDDVKLKALERDASANRALLEAMLGRYAEANARQDLSSQPGLGVIIQSAGVPSAPSFPKPGPMVLLITIAGLAVGLGIAFLIELMAAAARQTAREEADIDRATEMAPAMPVAPASPAAPLPRYTFPPANFSAEPEVAPAPKPVPPVFAAMQHLAVWPKIIPQGDLSGITDLPDVSAAANTMAKWAETIRTGMNVRRVGLTSLGGGTADAPVAALALARSVARTGKRVVLVDLARMGSFLGGLCGVPSGPGLADLVSGAVDFTKVIGRDQKSTVHVLRYGLDHSPHAADLIHERLQSVLDALAQAYDFAVINLGEAVDETPVMLEKCQSALIMAPASRMPEATQVVNELMGLGLKSAQHVLIGQPVKGSDAGAAGPVAVNG